MGKVYCTLCHKNEMKWEDGCLGCYTDFGDGPYCDECYDLMQARLDRVREENLPQLPADGEKKGGA